MNFERRNKYEKRHFSKISLHDKENRIRFLSSKLPELRHYKVMAQNLSNLGNDERNAKTLG